MAERAQYRRHLFVLDAIASGRYPTTEELAVEWEASERTIRRDIAYLRDMHDAPIEFDRDRNGFYLSDPDFRLPVISMTEGELIAMTVGEQVLNAYRDSPWHRPVHEAFAKIESLLPERVSVQAELVSRRVSVVTTGAAIIDDEVWRTVLEAVRHGRSLLVTYRSARATAPASRTIDPYRIVAHDGSWYIIGHSHHHGQVRVFSLARVAAARLADEYFEVPDTFDASDYIDPEFGVFNRSETGPRDVAIQFDREVAHLVVERRWHPTQHLVERDDGSVVLTFTTNQVDQVLFRVMSFGPAAEILSPPELRSRAADWAALMKSRYDRGG